MKEIATVIGTWLGRILARLGGCWLLYWLYNYHMADALNLPRFGFGIFVGLAYGLRLVFVNFGNDNDEEGK